MTDRDNLAGWDGTDLFALNPERVLHSTSKSQPELTTPGKNEVLGSPPREEVLVMAVIPVTLVRIGEIMYVFSLIR